MHFGMSKRINNNEDTVAIALGYDRRKMVREALTALWDAFTDRVKSAKQMFVHPIEMRLRGRHRIREP